VSLSEHIVDVNEATFGDEVLQRSFDVPVVVDFWAPWCAPCRTLGPILERAAIEAGGAFRLARVNVDDNPQLSIRFGVQGIPAVKAFRQGEVVSEFVGAQPEPVVHRFLERVAPAEVDAGLVRALGLQAARHWAEAEAAFRDVLAREETNPAASLGLVECLLMQGRGQQAKAALVDFPPSTEWATAEKLPISTMRTKPRTSARLGLAMPNHTTRERAMYRYATPHSTVAATVATAMATTPALT